MVRQALGGGGGRAQRPRCQNHGYNQAIEIKFCISHYSHKSMSDARFESGSLSSLEI